MYLKIIRKGKFMKEKMMTFLCAMTVGILFLQIVIISKLDNHYKDIISSRFLCGSCERTLDFSEQM